MPGLSASSEEEAASRRHCGGELQVQWFCTFVSINVKNKVVLNVLPAVESCPLPVPALS